MSEEVQKTEEELIIEHLAAAKALMETDPDLLGGKVVCTPIKDETRYSYVTKYFILDAKDAETFLLSFAISNYRIDKVASITNLLTLMFYDGLRIAEDHFIDINTNTAYYGDEAYVQFEQYVWRKQGLVKCPVCEEIVNKDAKYDQRGHCKFCHKEVLPYVTYH